MNIAVKKVDFSRQKLCLSLGGKHEEGRSETEGRQEGRRGRMDAGERQGGGRTEGGMMTRRKAREAGKGQLGQERGRTEAMMDRMKAGEGQDWVIGRQEGGRGRQEGQEA
jgi:hypothetical protein